MVSEEQPMFVWLNTLRPLVADIIDVRVHWKTRQFIRRAWRQQSSYLPCCGIEPFSVVIVAK